MKRWSYITAVRLNPGGGQTTHIIESCRVLASRRAVTLFAPAVPPEAIPHLDVQLVPLPARPPREIIFQTRLAHALIQAARDAQPHIIYTRAAAFNLGTLIAARRLGATCVLELNGLPALEYRLERHTNTWQSSARSMFYALVARLEARLAAGIVAVTPQLAAEARRWGAHHIHIAPNGVNPQTILPSDQQEARRTLNIPETAELVGFVGNFAAWQGLETLVRGALLLAPHRPLLHLLLIGDGVERPPLEHLAAPLGERVHFLGALAHRHVAGTLAACDILVAPLADSPRNRRTGVSPLKVFEYLAMERPVLAAGLPGLEFIEREGLGALFCPDDPHALAKQLATLLDQPAAQRAAIGARARRAAVERYAWSQIMDDVIAFAEGL